MSELSIEYTDEPIEKNITTLKKTKYKLYFYGITRYS